MSQPASAVAPAISRGYFPASARWMSASSPTTWRWLRSSAVDSGSPMARPMREPMDTRRSSGRAASRSAWIRISTSTGRRSISTTGGCGQFGGRARSCICARQRNVGEQRLFPCADTPAPQSPPDGFGGVLTRRQMERRRRLCRSGRRQDRHLVRYQYRYPGRGRRVETGSGAGAARLYPFRRG